MWYQLTSFLSFHFKTDKFARKLHSKQYYPVFKSLEKSVDSELIKSFKSYRNDLLKKKDCIEVSDFGAGSRVFNSNVRSIAKIARVAGMSRKKAKYLINICKSQSPNNILEIGTSLGIGTYAMCLGAPKAEITTLEGCTNTAQIAQEHFKTYEVQNINVVVGAFDKTIPALMRQNHFDLIYFDGNHSKSATIKYFQLALKTIRKGDVFIFDDVYWSREMFEAWKIIRSNTKVVSFYTTYDWGIVFF